MRSFMFFLAGFLAGVGSIAYAVAHQGDMEDSYDEPPTPSGAVEEADRILWEQRHGTDNK